MHVNDIIMLNYKVENQLAVLGERYYSGIYAQSYATLSPC